MLDGTNAIIKTSKLEVQGLISVLVVTRAMCLYVDISLTMLPVLQNMSNCDIIYKPVLHGCEGLQCGHEASKV